MNAKIIFTEIESLNPSTSIVSSVGSYVNPIQRQIADEKRAEVLGYIPEGTLAHKILTSGTITFSEKQLWVIAYELLKNEVYCEKLSKEIQSKNAREEYEKRVKAEKKAAIAAERKATGRSKKSYREEYDSLMKEYKATKNIELYKKAKSIAKFAF